MKRMILVLTLVAVLALALFGAPLLSPAAQSARPADGQAALLADPAPQILAGDEPICPPGVPPPCGGG